MTFDPWPVEWGCDGEPTGVDLDIVTTAAQAILWGRTGRRLGLITTTENYRIPVGVCGLPRPYKDSAGQWQNAVRCQCFLSLRERPVFDVTEVVLNGTPTTAWALEGHRLRASDGCWPGVDDCAAPIIAVTYRFGVALRATDPLYGLVAASMGEVGREIAEGLCGRPCKLPSRAINIARQGVTVTMGATDELAAKGLLGLPISDELIRTVNPGRLASRPKVYSPDMPRVH